MSGFAGALRLDAQREFPPRIVNLQSIAIERRGQDGNTIWQNEQIHLVHSHRDTTGSVQANLAVFGSKVLIAADMRLDNRASLAEELGFPTPDHLSDTDLLHRAYRRWGYDCCQHLHGDFAFALWDEDKKILLCARDHFGVKPLFHAQNDGMLLFGSHLTAVTLGNGEIQPDRIAGFMMGFCDDETQTIFKGAWKVPPGHMLVAEHGSVVLSRYWSLTLGPPAEGAQTAHQFRHYLQDAVADRLRGSHPTGAMLSGGLDSSSIAALSANLKSGNLETYSFHYPQTPKLDEREFVDAVLAQYPQRLHGNFVPFDDLKPLHGLGVLADGGSDLLFAPGLPKMTALFSFAHALGTRVLLDGHGGDEVASHGFGRLKELAMAGRWLALHRELRGVSQLFGDSANSLFIRYFTAFGPAKSLTRLTRRIRALGVANATPAGDNGFLTSEFAARTNMAERQTAWTRRSQMASGTERDSHLWNVTNPGVGVAFEALDRAAIAAGVDLRFPFFDRRLVGFAVNLPASEIMQKGWSRSILRRAMENVLPEKVQWRRDKIDFSTELRQGLVKHHKPILTSLRQDTGGIGQYLDLNKLGNAVDRLVANPSAPSAAELFGIWRSITLLQWLNSRENRT